MPRPRYCSNPHCPNHEHPAPRWAMRYGHYHTAAHGWVQRYRCRRCGATASTQSESLHYFAKRRLPLEAVWRSLLGGASMREVAWRYGVSPMAVQNAVLRLGRQAMAVQLEFLRELQPQQRVVYDGLRSAVVSADYPCDITTVLTPAGEAVLSMEHTVFLRGGRMRPAQRTRARARHALWRPPVRTMTEDISRICGELWDYLRPAGGDASASLRIDTDRHPLYLAALLRDPVAAHWRAAGALSHVRTDSRAPRTPKNPLFAVNYLDRLLRHRLREHTRETIAGGRHAVMQMHRAWMFAVDSNVLRPWRVRRPEAGVHSQQGAVDAETARRLAREFFTRRRRVARGTAVPQTIRRAWTGELLTPPVRWRGRRQQGTSVRIPGYARRELARGYPHAR